MSKTLYMRISTQNIACSQREREKRERDRDRDRDRQTDRQTDRHRQRVSVSDCVL